MAYKVSEIDMQFLACLVANPASLSELNYEIKLDDFDDPLYYSIYSEIVGFLIDNKSPTFSDLKLRFRDDKLVIDVIEKLRGVDFDISDINDIHSVMRERAKKAKFNELQKFLALELKSDKPSEQLIANLESRIAQISIDSDAQLCSIGDIHGEFITELRERVAKFEKSGSISQAIDLPTGFEQLDSYTLGMPLRNTCLIGGSTSDGKTQLAIQLANAAASYGHGVGYFLFEDSKKNFLIRLASLNTGIPITKIRLGNITRKQEQDITEWLQEAREQNNIFVDDNMADINDAIAKAKFMKLKFPHIKMFVFDNINLIRDFTHSFDNREREISLISKKILALSRSTETVGLILQQLNTNPDSRSGGLAVTNNDLRDSKAPSHDASVCLYLNFPDKYDEHKKFSREHGQIIIGKNRNGEPNKIVYITNKAHVGRFIEKEFQG